MRVILEKVGHQFSESRWLFSDLSIVLLPGRIYSVVGPSGSGKSTLLAILAGWVHPTSGSVHRSQVKRTGWVFQNPHGTPRRTAIDHVALPFLARGLSPSEADARSFELLKRFGLAETAERAFKSLSGGEAQRLMLARAVAAHPDLLLIDEPTAQLDSSTTQHVNLALARLTDNHTIVVVATHDPTTRSACSDHIDLADFSPGSDR